jgi:Ca-activated chloride channel family protein
MTLKYPILLLLLLLVPVLAWLRHAARRRTALRFSDGETVRKLPIGLGVALQPLLPLLFAAGLALLVVALARPQKGLTESKVHTEAVDIVLVVDVSTSMRAEDFSTATERMNRLEAAKRVIETFIKNRPNDRIGLVAFSALPYSVAPLTLDHGWLLQQVKRLETGMLEDGTAIGTAIASGANRLRESKAKSKIMVLLTDGMNNRGEITPDNASEAAKALGIKLYTVGAGGTGWVMMPFDTPFGTQYQRTRADVDDAMLTRVAETTGGRYFRATDFASLKRIYEDIDAMEKTEVDVEQYTRYEEKFAPFVILALGCLCLERLLGLSRFGRLP